MHGGNEGISTADFLSFSIREIEDNPNISDSVAAECFSGKGHLNLRLVQQRKCVCAVLTGS